MLTQIILAASLAISALAGNSGIGKKARDFTLRSIAGEEISLSSLQGKVVLINFWATWCAPCREELPQLALMQEKFSKRGLVVLGVTVDNDPENVKAFLKKYELKLQTLWDREKKIAAAYNVATMPSSFIIDRNGVLRYVHQGFDAKEFKRIVAEVDDLLDKASK